MRRNIPPPHRGCRKRFAALVEAEKAEAREKREDPLPAEGAAPSAPPAEADVRLFEDEPEVPASVVLIKSQKATSYNNHRLECSCNKLPRFGRPKSFVPACMASKSPLGDLQQTNDIPSSSSSSSQFRVPNKRHRKQMNQKKGIGPDSPLFEFACDPESQMGITSEKYGIPHIRLSKEFGDLTDPEVQAQVDYQIEACPRAPNMWGAIPCTAGSVWQRLNAARLGPSFRAYLRRQKSQSKKLFASFADRAELVLSRGGTVTFEWPVTTTDGNVKM